MKSFLKIIIFIIVSCAVSAATDYRTMCCSDKVITAETASAQVAVFEASDYAYTLRTINHILNEQKAEVACLPIFSLDKAKHLFTLHSYTEMQKRPVNQCSNVSLLLADYSSRKRYIPHSYYIFTLERILI